MTEINNQNKLIADFMGYYMETINEGDEWTSYAWRDSSKNLLTWMIEIAPPFHSSWDWLMPVVENIEKTGKALVITLDWDNEYNRHDALIEVPSETILVSKKTRIEAIYNAVVQFIEWHRYQK